VGVADEKWGEAGVAFVIAHGEVGAEELLTFLSARLARYKLPKQIVFLPELPRTAYGKVIKRELRERWQRSRGAGA